MYGFLWHQWYKLSGFLVCGNVKTSKTEFHGILVINLQVHSVIQTSTCIILRAEMEMGEGERPLQKDD